MLLLALLLLALLCSAYFAVHACFALAPRWPGQEKGLNNLQVWNASISLSRELVKLGIYYLKQGALETAEETLLKAKQYTEPLIDDTI